LKLLSLRGCTVTIDAMGCQKRIAAQIRAQKGHYVLALKGNQSRLDEDLQQLHFRGIDTDFAGLSCDEYETTETGHGRTTTRNVHVIAIPQEHPQRRVWKDLRTLAVVTTCRTEGDKETWETRWYVSSHAPRAKGLARAIRKHWDIENGQHWVLDITFAEDARRQQDRHGATNLAAVRRLAVSLLRQDQTIKRGAKCKRMTCALDPNYLLRVFHNAKIDA
jgi:predicted transposase YbfD/YdcC